MGKCPVWGTFINEIELSGSGPEECSELRLWPRLHCF